MLACMQARIHVYETLRGDIIKRGKAKKTPGIKMCQALFALRKGRLRGAAPCCHPEGAAGRKTGRRPVPEMERA